MSTAATPFYRVRGAERWAAGGGEWSFKLTVSKMERGKGRRRGIAASVVEGSWRGRGVQRWQWR
jgi:hypothetical protein